MKMQKISTFIYAGLGWRYLQDATSGRQIHGAGLILGNLRTLMRRLESFGMRVTYNAAQASLGDLINELADSEEDATLTEAQAELLKTEMRELQRTLSAEGTTIHVYSVTEKRLSTDLLLNSPQKLFAPRVYDKLSEVARFDFAEACMCIAFERGTAAAFHMLRATEEVLCNYYKGVIRQNRVDPLLWGPMTESMRKKKSTRAPDVLLNSLDNIRRSYRNPTTHPDKMYDIHDAQSLFPLCVDVVNQMVKSNFWK